MNRSKTDFSTTARRQWRAGGVCQESRRTTTTTESESDKSQVSTLARGKTTIYGPSLSDPATRDFVASALADVVRVLGDDSIVDPAERASHMLRGDGTSARRGGHRVLGTPIGSPHLCGLFCPGCSGLGPSPHPCPGSPPPRSRHIFSTEFTQQSVFPNLTRFFSDLTALGGLSIIQ